MATTQTSNLAATCERLHKDYQYLENAYRQLENAHRELETIHRAALDEKQQLADKCLKQEMQIWQMQLEIEAQRQQIARLTKKTEM